MQNIHILDAEVLPEPGSQTIANCGAKIAFNPIEAYWTDGRVCERCLELHRDGRLTRYTAASMETHDPEEASFRVRDKREHGDYVGPISDQAGISAHQREMRLIK